MTVVEFSDYKIILRCVYRLPDSDIHIFFNNLEIVIQKVQSKGKKKLILCGDWDINFHINLVTVLDLGYSYHQAQILCMNVENPKRRLVKKNCLLR